MASYKQKINPRTGKFDMVGGGEGGSGIQGITSNDSSLDVQKNGDKVDLSVKHQYPINVTSGYENATPTVKGVIDYVNQERGKLEVIKVSDAVNRYKRFIEVRPAGNTTYYRLTAMVMGASGNPDMYGMLEVSFGYNRPGTNPNYCYAYWVCFTEGNPSQQQYQTPPDFRIWVSSDQSTLIIGAKCPSNLYQTLELHIVTENLDLGSKIHGTNSTLDVVQESWISAATKVEISKLSLTKDDLLRYATQDWVNSQGYLKSVPSGYALISDLPTKASQLENDTKVWIGNTYISDISAQGYVFKYAFTIATVSSDIKKGDYILNGGTHLWRVDLVSGATGYFKEAGVQVAYNRKITVSANKVFTAAELLNVEEITVMTSASTMEVKLPEDSSSLVARRIKFTIVPANSTSRVFIMQGSATLYASTSNYLSVLDFIYTGTSWKFYMLYSIEL